MADLDERSDLERPGDEDDAQRILTRILDDLDREGSVDPEALRAEFPHVPEEEIARLCSAATRYEEEALFLRMDWEAAREQEAPHLESGTIVGDYVVETPIGRGGMGRVYRARQRSLGDRRVALKVLPAGETSGGREERFSREARAASSLHHPNLAEVYGFGTEGGVHYYAMRLVEGPTLREVLDELAANPELRRKRSVRRRIVRRVAEVAGALSTVHENGLVHRDVKPSNILLEGPSRERIADRAAVLVDFGLVRPIDTDAATMTRNTPATPAYAAPELLLGQEVDARADVFSLGVTLHDLLAGRRPTERMQASAGLEPLTTLAPEVDPDLAAIVAKATDPMAKWRYADAAALQRDLQAWVDGLPVAARTQGLLETGRRWIRRHPWTAVRTAAAVLLLALAGATAAWTTDVLARTRGAREAYERGDVETLVERLEPLPRRAPGTWLVGAELLDARAQLLDGVEGPLRGLGEAVRREDHRAFVDAAVRQLAFAGLEAAVLPRRALLHRLREDGVATGALTPRLEAAIARTTLLFAERPDASPEASAASAEFRERLVELLGWSLPPQSALQVVAALGGCGTPAEVADILAWIDRDVGAGPVVERRRMGLTAVQSILERAPACGHEDDLARHDVEQVAFRMAALAARPLTGEVVQELDGRAWKTALRTLALVARRRGARSPLEALASVPLHDDLRLDLLCIAQRDDAYPSLHELALDAQRAVAGDLWRFGWRCALYGDADVLAAARDGLQNLGRLEGKSGTHYLEPFDRGGAAGLDELGGRYDLPQPMLLGLVDLTALPVEPNWTRSLDQDPGVLAAWSFHEGASLQGWATGGATFLAPPGESGHALDLTQPGASRVRLRMTVQGDYPLEALNLMLLHSRTPRPQLPYAGSADFEVRFDDEFLARRRMKLDELGENVVALPIDRIEPGDHELEIVLADATTRYHLAGAWIEVPEARAPEAAVPIPGREPQPPADPALQTPGGPGDRVAGGQ